MKPLKKYSIFHMKLNYEENAYSPNENTNILLYRKNLINHFLTFTMQNQNLKNNRLSLLHLKVPQH